MIHTVEYQSSIRLDRFLKHQYGLLTQGIIQKSLRAGNIKVNNIKAKDSSARLQKGDVISIYSNFEQYTETKETKIFNQSIQALSKKILGQYLIFANDDFIAINKPAKIATQGGTNINISIDDALKYLNQQQNTICYKLVHRLDKETSGVMLIAKNYDAAVKLTSAFERKKIYKTYLALTHGEPDNNQGSIELKDELTHYKVLQYCPKTNISYIEFKPITGKEHQIRRHAIEIGVSIIGDAKYGIKDKGHMMLHSASTIIDEQVFGHKFCLQAELPEYFYLQVSVMSAYSASH